MTYEAFWGTFWVGVIFYRLVSTGALAASAAYWQAYMVEQGWVEAAAS